MSQDGSKSLASRKPSASRVSGSTYSVNTTLRKTRAGLKEEMIAKKITEIFKEKEQRMIRTIEQTITEDRLRIYKLKRAEFEEELTELEAERKRIVKRKKNKKEKMKLLKQNTRQQFCFIAKALNATVLHYKVMYYENDYYRFKKLLDVCVAPEGEPAMTEKAKQQAQLDQLNNFYMSPFKDDRRFVVYHLAQITRDRLESSRPFVKALFFGKIFDLLLKTTDEKNRLKAFEILCNLVQSAQHRKSLAKEGYFKQVYETMQIGKVDDKTLEKLSWMTTLICFHPDMIDQIVQLKLLNFIIKLVDNKYPAPVRSNAVLAISLLTYHESLFNELITNGVIDIVMNLCMDQHGDLQVKQFSTLALVHFALSKQSINILIEKGIMDLFNSLGVIGDAQIQTNVSWIFLALCNNGITGRQMLTNGITRDMFLVSCNPQFNQIRHLVIAGFAELGRCTDMREHQERQHNSALQRIKEKAIVGMHDAFRLHADETINILLRFSISQEQKFMVTAFWALKDYILLNHDKLISDLSGVICAFVNGSAEESDAVKTECANAISFLITHQLVFNQADASKRKQVRDPSAEVYMFNDQQNYVLDALMYLSGSESLQVRTRAFSTLSTLSTYASQSEELMPQIQADIMMPKGMISRQYYKFILDRIAQSRAAFVARYKQEDIETKYAGLYCLLRLAQSPDEAIAIETAVYLHQFYYPEHYHSVDIQQQLEELTQCIDEDLNQEQKERLSINLVSDTCDVREIVLDALNEKFFMFVFQALLYSKNQRILYLLLDVINFYIKHATVYQDKVINAATILWMLQILGHSRKDRALCLLVAKTVLKIVDNHQILFDYQEMAIIKKFNKALENLNKDANDESDPSSEEEPLKEDHYDRITEQQSSQFQSIATEARQQLELQLKGKLNIPLDMEIMSERFKNTVPIDYEQENAHLTEQSKESVVKKGISVINHLEESKCVESFIQLGSIKQTSKTPSQPSEMLPQESSKSSLIKTETSNRDDSPIIMDQSPVLPLQFRKQATNLFQKRDHSFLDKKVQGLSETEKSNNELRDALIKSFMVIFTNEKSQHLLLNQDIIDIAFSCLEYCDSISVDAKRNLARLISIIFKFPQVQERILQDKIVHGIVHLLSQDLSQTAIISHALRSCTYISLSYNFVNSPLSLLVLQALTPLMDKLDQTVSTSQKNLVAQKVSSPAEVMSDKDNCLFAISNLLKGSQKNAEHFIQSDSASKVMHELIGLLKSGDLTKEKLENIEICVASVKQLANTKQTFKEFLGFNQVNKTLLTDWVQRVFDISDDWHKCTSELLRFQKILQTDQHVKVVQQRMNSKAVLNITHSNVKTLKEIEIEESKEDRSIKMAAVVKIRNNLYYIIVGCFKAGFSIDFLLQQCNLLPRLVQDLQRDQLNDYLFQHLILCLQSLMKDQTALKMLFSDFSKELQALFTDIQQMDKKIVFIKSIIQSVLRIPEQLCDSNPTFFGHLFSMATSLPQDKKYKSEVEDITENVLWLQTTLLELNLSDSQCAKAVDLCIKFKTAPVLVSCLTSQNERIVLQALKGLGTLSTFVEFKTILLFELGDLLFVTLAEIINRRMSGFKKYKLEIETNIVALLSSITLVVPGSPDTLTIAARKRVVQQGFVDSFVVRCLQSQYKIELVGDDEILSDDLDTYGDCQGLSNADFDDIDKITDDNQLLEHTMQLIANATELQENHFLLLNQRSQIKLFVTNVTNRYLTHVQQNCDDPPFQMLELSFGNLKMGKSIAQVLEQLLTCQVEGVTDIQEMCVKAGLANLTVQIVQHITDYEMHIKLYQALVNVAISTNEKVQALAVDQGCVKEIQKAATESEFHKVRRICGVAAEKIQVPQTHERTSKRKLL